MFQPLVAAVGRDLATKVITYPESKPAGYAELLSIVQSALPTQGPYVLLGESFSGPLAIAIAATRPQGLEGLILCSTFARNPHRPLRWLRFAIDAVPFSSIVKGLGARALFGRFLTQPLRQQFLRAVNRVAPAVFRARIRAVLQVDVTRELVAVAVPMLYLQARADYVVPRSAAALIQRLRPDIRLVEVDAPHCLLQAVPREAAHIVAEFVGSLAERELPI
ncbi:alpha/beta hydrolase [Ralstonia pseudosolanacearum]|nr:alpha/beta hydrolase [Ralstonia pseudosolanacearum]